MGAASRAAQPSSPPPTRGEAGDAVQTSVQAAAFPFDASPYQRFLVPLGRIGELGQVRRRTIIVIALAWVPLVVLGAIQGLAIRSNPRESVLFDFAVHSRYLIALPLLVVAEYVTLPQLGRIARHFMTSGLLADVERPRFDALIVSTRRLLSSPVAAIVITALAYVYTLVLSTVVNPAGISTWASPMTDGTRALSLAGWWRALVSQPLYVIMVGAWVWRALVWGIFVHRAARLNLRLVASHPDHMGGLEFVTYSVRAFPIVGFALAAAMAGGIAQLAVYDGRPITDFTRLIGVIVGLVAILFVLPLLTLRGPLKRLRTRGVLAYGELGSDIGRQFEARWLRPGEDVTNEALEAPDFSAVTDAYQIIANASAIRLIPIEIRGAALLVLGTLLPFVPVLMLSIPFVDMLKFAANFLL